MKFLNHLPALASLLGALALQSANAGTATAAASGKNIPETAVTPKEESIFDKIWGLTKLYEDKSNPFIQELRIGGRYHGQYHWADGDTAEDDGWEDRRFRIGLEGKFLHEKLSLKADMVSGSDFDPFYNGFTELYLQYKVHDAFAITVGKQKPRFTYDWSTSSRYHNYFERSQLTNQFRPDYTPGVAFSGKLGSFSYYTGLFSNSPSDNVGDEFSEFDGGASFIAQIGYDLKEMLKTDSADWRLDYLYSDHNDKSTIFDHFDHGVATSIAIRQGKASIATELLYGFGSDAGDALGANIMPGYFITDKLQLVGRYQIATSDGAKGLSAQRRYERSAGLGKGDLYQAAYAGFNYYLYGHKLKLMGGVEYADLGDHDAWTALLGVRIFWGGESKGAFPTGYPKTND